MYSVSWYDHTIKKTIDLKFDTFEKAKRFAWEHIKKPNVFVIEVWLGGQFQGRIKKEGNL